MADILKKIFLGMGVLNPSSGAPGGQPIRDIGNGILQTREVIAEAVKRMAEPPTPDEVLGQVVSAPFRVRKSSVVNFFNTSFFSGGEENEAGSKEYMKVHVRIPEEHTCLPFTKQLTDVMAKMTPDDSFVSELISDITDAALIQLYPYFLLPLSEDTIQTQPPKVGDIVSVKFTDTLRTQGTFVRTIERIQALSTINRGYGAHAGSSSQGFDNLFTPIDTVALSQGPGALSDQQADALGWAAGSQNLPCCTFVSIWVLTQRALIPSDPTSVQAWAAMAPSIAWWGAANIYDAKRIWSNITAYKAALGGTEMTVDTDYAPELEIGRWHIVQKWCWSDSPITNPCQTCQNPSPGSGHTYLVYANPNGSFRIMDSSSARGFRDKIDSWFKPGCEYRVLTLPRESVVEDELSGDIYGESVA